MHKALVAIIITGSILLGTAAIGAACTFGTSNGAITREHEIEENQVDINTKRFAANTKLGNLESALDSSNEHYLDVINAITSARDADFTASCDSLTTAVNLIVENYPEEAGNQELYQTYMNTVVDVVEQVAKTAKVYNESVKDYKVYCEKFPARMFLSIAGYKVKTYSYIELEVSPTWSSKQYV